MQARKTHRKRVSALRLSSDTTTSLPAYIPTGGWVQDGDEQGTPLDLPPDYPDSAEEADEDTDDGKESVYAPQFTTSSSAVTTPLSPSRRPFRRPSVKHRRKQSSTNSSDIYLDSLLERSVHALEMSNALLQSSISTQTSLSTILGSESPRQGYSYHNQEDSTDALERSARGLSSRIRNNRAVHETWVEDLDEIRRDVEALFSEDGHERRNSNESTHSTSSSLPASTSPLHTYKQHRHQQHHSHRRRPSLDAISQQKLRYDLQDRDHLVAYPPRALTQYVVANGDADDDTIVLPSTLGLRSSSSSFHASAQPSPSLSPLPQPRTSRSTSSDTPRAYDVLSSFVSSSRQGPSSASTSSTRTSSPITNTLGSGSGSKHGSRKRRQSNSSSSTGSTVTQQNQAQAQTQRSRSQTPKPLLSSSSSGYPTPCPPIEEGSSLPSSSRSSSSLSSTDSNPTKQTILSLRKILDEAPPPPPPPLSDTEEYIIVRRPTLPPQMIRKVNGSRGEAVEAGTSTATASVSRLFSKAGRGGVHSSSTRPPSPPRLSSIKGRRGGGIGSAGGTPGVSSPVNEESRAGTPQEGLRPNTPLPSSPLPATPTTTTSKAAQALTDSAGGSYLAIRKGKGKIGLGVGLPEFIASTASGFGGLGIGSAFRRSRKVGEGVSSGNGSKSGSPNGTPAGSGTSTPSRTPKRISFAEPDREGEDGLMNGLGSGFGFGVGGGKKGKERERDGRGSLRRKSKAKTKTKVKDSVKRRAKGKSFSTPASASSDNDGDDDDDDEEGRGSWWWWLVGPSGTPSSPGAGGGGRWGAGGYGAGKAGYGGGPGFDEWTV